LAILYLITTPPRSNTNQVENTQVPQVTAIPIKTINTFPANTNANYTYVGNHFQITFSTDTYTASGNKDNGEDHIVLKYKNTDLTTPFIDIQVASSAKLPVQRIIDIFQYRQFTHNDVVIDRNNAIEYTGSIERGDSFIYDTVVVFTRNNFTYKIELSYQSSKEDPAIQEAFNKILSNTIIY
jgi:hypothetical protein